MYDFSKFSNKLIQYDKRKKIVYIHTYLCLRTYTCENAELKKYLI